MNCNNKIITVLLFDNAALDDMIDVEEGELEEDDDDEEEEGQKNQED